MSAALDIRGLRVRRGEREILRGVSFGAEPKQLLSVADPSTPGTTMPASSVSGSSEPSS